MVELWVCPACNMLLGIDVIDNKAYCVSCGMRLNLNDIDFIDNKYVSLVKKRIYEMISEEYHQYLRFRWLSNRTVGIMLDFDEEELMERFPDLFEKIEDELVDELDLFITLIFE